MIRRFLFQLHLWSGLILGIVFVLIGLSGSILIVGRSLYDAPVVHVTAVTTPALDKGLAAARAAVGAPRYLDFNISFLDGPNRAIVIGFGGAVVPASVRPVLIDPATGRVLATMGPSVPPWFGVVMGFLHGFHTSLSMPNAGIGEMVEGWLGVIMAFLGLTGLYLWWPKAGQWKYGFIVRRKAKGLRFHCELHGAAGIWTLVLYLVVTTTGVAFEFPQATGAVLAFMTREDMPRFGGTPTVTVPAGAVPVGPDAVLAAAHRATDQPVEMLEMPGWKPDRPTSLAVTVDTFGMAPVYIDPFRGTIINPTPTNSAYNIQIMMLRIHEGLGLGLIEAVLVFISGLMPLIFFVTGLMMWLKKRQNRLAMSQPIPESILEQQAS